MSKTRRISSENGRPEIFCKNGRFSAKTRGLESLQLISRITLVITFHKLYHRHSDRLSLRSSETKSHQHRNIKAFSPLNPCPKLIDLLIWITIRRIPQIPVNTYVRSHVQLYTQKSLRKRLPPSPTNAPHSSGQKRQTARIPLILGTQRAAIMAIKPH